MSPHIDDATVQRSLLAAGWGPIKSDAIFRTVRTQDATIKELEAKVADLEAQAIAAPEVDQSLEKLKDVVVSTVRLAMLELDQGDNAAALDRLRELCLALA